MRSENSNVINVSLTFVLNVLLTIHVQCHIVITVLMYFYIFVNYLEYCRLTHFFQVDIHDPVLQ